MLINDNFKVAKAVKADGVHHGQTDSCPTIARKHFYSWQIIGGTANTFQDCETLLDKQVNYISLGPFRASTTNENTAPVLGLMGYTAITDVLKTGTPIIGVGGIIKTDVKTILEAGISGIAFSEAITRDFNSISEFHQLLNASSSAAQRYTFDN